MKAADFRGRLFVVTGASSGLGREIARVLAVREGAHVALAARRAERLEWLAAEIGSSCGSRAHVIPLDLGAPASAQTLFEKATALGEVYGLVNCAGITYYGRTLDAPIEKIDEILSVNFLVEMKTTMLFLDYFLRRGSGAILTVTSATAFLPLPFQNVYAATKHGMQAFMEGLAQEYRGRGVSFSTFAPGGMATEMIKNSGTDKKYQSAIINMDPARAARIAVASFKRGKMLSVPGLLYKTVVFLARRAPRAFVAWAVGKAYSP
jgi:short-subunit dehydrogenase